MVCLGEDEGEPVIYRIRSEVPTDIDSSEYANLIKIMWSYQPDERGLPGEEDNEQMEVLEDLLEEYADRSGIAVMTLVITGNGAREWHLYSREGEETLALIDRLGREGPFSINTSQESDPGWTAYGDILKAATEE